MILSPCGTVFQEDTLLHGTTWNEMVASFPHFKTALFVAFSLFLPLCSFSEFNNLYTFWPFLTSLKKRLWTGSVVFLNSLCWVTFSILLCGLLFFCCLVIPLRPLSEFPLYPFLLSVMVPNLLVLLCSFTELQLSSLLWRCTSSLYAIFKIFTER